MNQEPNIKPDDNDDDLDDMIDIEDLIPEDEMEDDDDLWDALLQDADELEVEHTKNVATWDKHKQWMWVTGLVLTVLLISVIIYKRFT